MLIMFLPFVGSAFAPALSMPVGVRQFAEYQPFNPAIETVRGLLDGAPIGHNAAIAVAWCVVLGRRLRVGGVDVPKARGALTVCQLSASPLRQARHQASNRKPAAGVYSTWKGWQGRMKNSLKAAISIAAAIGALALPAGTASATSNPPPNGGGIACLPETITDPTAPQWEEITLITQGQGICVAANGGAGYYELAMQYDGNLVLYNPYGHAIWSTNTWNTVASYAIMQDDGNFVLYDWNKHPYWDSKTWGHPGSYLYLQADGNLVVYAPGGGPVTGHALWASGTYGK